MSTLITVKQVKSLTVGFTFPETYDMSRAEEIKVYLGKNVYPHTIDGRVVKCQIKSDDTAVMYGANRLSFWLDDSIIGVYPVYCGNIIFEYTNAIEHNESVNTGFDLLVNLAISETAITVDNVLYNYFKGDKGDPFIYDDFTPEQIEALKVKGDAFEFSDFTPEQIALLQKPASDIATTVSNAEGLRVTAETNRNNAEGLRLSAEIIRNDNEAGRIEAEVLRAGAETGRQTAEGLRQQAELNRQTNTSTAIFNAEQATYDANNAAILANEKAGLANNAALLAIEKAGLAVTAATQANTARDGANDAAQSATNLVNSYATDLAAKELKANKQNSLTADGTGTKFPTVDAVNEGLNLKQDKNFIGEYIHSGNKEVIISDYNATTGVFTSLAHGMVNGTALYFVARKTVTYPLSVIPDSANLSSQYYVVESTNDTFKLASTAGEAAIIFGNTTISLADFFLEVRPYQVVINFGAFYNNLVQIAISNNARELMGVNFTIGSTGWRSGNPSDYQIPLGTSNAPTVTGYMVSEYRFINGICFIRQNGQVVYASTKTSNGVTTHNNRVVTKVMAETGINGITLYHPSNGQKLLFYKL